MPPPRTVVRDDNHKTPVSGEEEQYDDVTKTTKSSLVITTANRDDMGEYSCTADFGGSIVISKPASILLFGEIRDENIIVKL